VRRAPALAQLLAQRMHGGNSSRRAQITLGDFDRRLPSLDSDERSVYNELVRRFLRPRLATFAGRGIVLGVGDDAEWRDVLPAAADARVVHATGELGRELAEGTLDWVVLDRCLQRLPEPTAALGEVVSRLKPGATVMTLLTGIARAESERHRPFWTVAPYAARRLHEEHRALEHVAVDQYGNATLALAWLYRLPAENLTERELASTDPAYPVLVAVSGSKRGASR
jgi:hypothetical protein